MASNEPTTAPSIDLTAVKADVDKLSPEEVKKQLLAIRTRQKVQQKKHQGSSQQKAYQLKARERARLLKARAVELGYYDEINEEAEKAADAKLEAVAAEQGADSDVE